MLKNGDRSLLFRLPWAAGLEVLARVSCVNGAQQICEEPGCSLWALLGHQQCIHNYCCLKDEWGFVSSGCMEYPRTPLHQCLFPASCAAPHGSLAASLLCTGTCFPVSSHIPIPHQVPEMPLNSVHFAQWWFGFSLEGQFLSKLKDKFRKQLQMPNTNSSAEILTHFGLKATFWAYLSG